MQIRIEFGLAGMKEKREVVSCTVVLFLIVYTVFPWIAPAYNHNLVLSVRLSASSRNPTYDVLLQNLAIWPVTLTDAQWLVAHFGQYNYWVPSEAPVQNLTLLPYQSHSFQFTIYNGTATTVREYFNGTLTVDLYATISVFGEVSQAHITATCNVTRSQ